MSADLVAELFEGLFEEGHGPLAVEKFFGGKVGGWLEFVAGLEINAVPVDDGGAAAALLGGFFVVFVGSIMFEAGEKEVSEAAFGGVDGGERVVGGNKLMEEPLGEVFGPFAGMALVTKKSIERKPVGGAKVFETFGSPLGFSAGEKDDAPVRGGEARALGVGLHAASVA